MGKELNQLLEKLKCFDKVEKLEILNHLSDKEITVEKISEKTKIKFSTVYKHIQQMMKAGIVTQNKLSSQYLFKIDDIDLSINKDKIKEIFKKNTSKDKLIIFDLDDTLARRTDIPNQLKKIGKRAIDNARLLLQEKGVSITYPPKELFSDKWIHSKYGNSIEWYISSWLTIAGVSDIEVNKKLTKKYVKEYYKYIEVSGVECELFKDVKPFLEKTKGIYFAANSNSSKKTIIEIFKNNDILRYFKKQDKLLIVGGDEIPKSKEAIQHLIKLSKIPTENCYLIGDTGGDIKVGREAGISHDRTLVIDRKITPIESIKIIKPKTKIINSLNKLKF